MSRSLQPSVGGPPAASPPRRFPPPTSTRRFPVLAAVVSALCAASSLPLAAQSEEDPYELPGLVVTATPVPVALSALGTHVTLLSGDDLRARGLTRVSDALREVPGLAVVQNGSFGAVTSVFFRGGESDYVQVMVDGVQMNQPGGSFDFSGLTTADVERIEVVRGPSSALHGSDAVGGVIHVITRDGSTGPAASARIEGGTYGQLGGTLSFSGGSDRNSYGVTLTRDAGDGILAFNNDYRNTVLTGKASLAMGDRSRARIAARFADRDFHFPTDGSGAVVDENQFTFNDEASVSVELDRALGDRVELRALLTGYQTEGGTDDAPDGPADTLGFFGYQSLDTYRRAAADLRANVTLAPEAVLTAGGEYERQRIRSFNESASAFGTSTGRSTNERDNLAGYLHLVGGRDAVRGNAGVRFEDNEAYGTFLSWQAGVSVALPAELRLRGAVGRGIKEPTFAETFSTGFTRGNPDLAPERSLSWELGLERAWSGGIRTQVTYFDQSFEDLIQYTGAPAEPEDPDYYNVAAARARGLEASVGGGWGRLDAQLDLTWLDTEVTDAGFAEGPGANFVEGQSLLRRPEITGGATVGWRLVDGLRAHVGVRHTGEREDRDFTMFPAEPVTLEAYTLLNAGVDWMIRDASTGGPGLSLTLQGRNLTDAAYEEVWGFEAPGRIVTVGARVMLGG